MSILDRDDDELPEREFVQGIAERLPRKRIAAGALLRDGTGRMLLVEPVYKPTWDLPGGVVEADEAPLDACRRELDEELGLQIRPTRLLVVDWMPRSGPWHDGLAFIFDGGTLGGADLARIRLPADELRAVHLTTLEEAAPRLRADMVRRLAVALEVASAGTPEAAAPRYLHHGRRAW